MFWRTPVTGVRGDTQRAQAMLELFHAGHLAARRVQELSGGERGRVLLARALAPAPRLPAPRLLLLDEPFAGMDHALRAELLDDLRGYLAEHPVPVLSVTHDVSEVFALDADVIVLDAGRGEGPGRCADRAGGAAGDDVARASVEAKTSARIGRIRADLNTYQSVPQRLKPLPYERFFDTAEAVSLSKARRQKQSTLRVDVPLSFGLENFAVYGLVECMADSSSPKALLRMTTHCFVVQ